MKKNRLIYARFAYSNQCTIIKFTSYIYIYRRTRYVKRLNYRLSSDTVSNESNSFDLRRSETSLLKSAPPPFFSIRTFQRQPPVSTIFNSLKIMKINNFIVSITFQPSSMILFIIIVQSILDQLSQVSIHFSTRAYYIRRSHNWIPLHGSLPWNINRRPKCDTLSREKIPLPLFCVTDRW